MTDRPLESENALLIQQYVAEELDEEDARRLWERLEADPTLEDILFRQIMLDRSLREKYDPKRHMPRGHAITHSAFNHCDNSYDLPDPDELSRLAALSPSLPRNESVQNLPASKRKKPLKRTESDRLPILFRPFAFLFSSSRSTYRKEATPHVRGVLLTALVLGLFLTAIYWEFKPAASPKSVPFHATGQVRASVDVRWPEGVEALKPGQSVATDRIRFEEGLLELELKNGIRLALEGPIDFKINSAMRTFCGLGRLSASVPKEGKGFTVSTPFNDVTDLGTEFYLDVKDEKVQTHTITGLVSLGKLPNNTTKDLPEGKAFSIDTQGSMNDFPADASLFQDEKTVQKLFHAVQRRELSDWEKRLLSYRNDPGLVLLFDFEDAGSRIANRSVRPNHGGDGVLRGVRRSTGRWPNKGAVAFQSKGAAIDIRVPGEFQSLTLAASVRIDALDRFVHYLLAGNEGDRGAILWQLGSDGVLILAVRENADVPAVKYSSTPIFSQRHCGAWFHLTTVVDAENRTVSHYLDGKLVNVVTITKPIPIRIDEAGIGNGIRNARSAADCSFRGRIDEFMIFDRALSADEVFTYFNPPTP